MGDLVPAWNDVITERKLAELERLEGEKREMRRRNEQFERTFEREQTLNTLLAQKVRPPPPPHAHTAASCHRSIQPQPQSVTRGGVPQWWHRTIGPIEISCAAPSRARSHIT